MTKTWNASVVASVLIVLVKTNSAGSAAVGLINMEKVYPGNLTPRNFLPEVAAGHWLIGFDIYSESESGQELIGEQVAISLAGLGVVHGEIIHVLGNQFAHYKGYVRAYIRGPKINGEVRA